MSLLFADPQGLGVTVTLVQASFLGVWHHFNVGPHEVHEFFLNQRLKPKCDTHDPLSLNV